MSDALQPLLVACISLLLSIAVLRALSGPLRRVLNRLCPDEAAAEFWLRYSQALMTLGPLLVVLLCEWFGHQADAVDAVRLAVLTALVGLLIVLALLGRTIKRFVVVRQDGGRT